MADAIVLKSKKVDFSIKKSATRKRALENLRTITKLHDGIKKFDQNE